MLPNLTHLFKLGAPWVLAFYLSMSCSSSYAQDLHYSQFYNEPMVYNPALTGIFNGDHRFIFSFRDQGRNVPVPYLSFTAAYDRKLYAKSSDRRFFGVGGFINYDKQGDSNLRLININLTGSYSYLINDRNIISLGGLLGFGNRAFDPTNLTWDSQWNTTTNTFNSSAPSGENFSYESFNFLETALGFNYRWQKSVRTKVDLGVGAYHISQPNTTFYNNTSEELPMRLSFYGIGTMELTPKLDIQLDALYQIQNVYRGLQFGSYLNMYLNQARGKNRQFRVGAGYKTIAEVLFIKAGVQINEWFVSASYDIDFYEFSRLDPVDPSRGPEVHIRYIIKNVKPQGKFKVCPIF